MLVLKIKKEPSSALTQHAFSSKVYHRVKVACLDKLRAVGFEPTELVVLKTTCIPLADAPT